MMPNEPAPPGAVSGSSEANPPAGDRASRQAQLALRQHAALFEALGMRAKLEPENAILLEDEDLSFSLEYGLRWRLLSRIYNLCAGTEITPPGPHADLPYRLTLKTRGLVGASRELAAVGPAAEAGRTVADGVMASGVVDELAGAVDLEGLTIAWVPEAESWRVALEPYPGSYIYMLFPPIRYTVRLKGGEAVAIREFFLNISRVLRQIEP